MRLLPILILILAGCRTNQLVNVESYRSGQAIMDTRNGALLDARSFVWPNDLVVSTVASIIVDGAKTDDAKAQTLLNYVVEHIEYKADYGDFWQFPNETISRSAGDCEDMAILLASFLLSQIGDDSRVYVAIGSYSDNPADGHAFVAYRRDSGDWVALDTSSPGSVANGEPLMVGGVYNRVQSFFNHKEYLKGQSL